MLTLAAGTLPAFAEEPTAEDLVNALEGVFGAHPGKRRAHAKGFCVKGDFTPAAGAADLSKAPHFAKTVPIFGRFSIGGGNPAVPDTAQGPVRSLALRFDPDGEGSDLVMISAPVHFAKTGEQMLEFLKLRTTPPGAKGPDQEKIKAFSEAHPETTVQGKWLAARPVPASYATTDYWAVHAFTFTNAKGEKHVIKYMAIPDAGVVGLTDDELKAKSPDFYKEEIAERLKGGPVSFKLVAIMGEPSDPTDDPTAIWPEDRKTAPLGTIRIAALEDDAVCDGTTIDPANLPAGIDGPENDKIFVLRSAAYAISLTRRSAP
jgi:catalase